MANPVKGEVPLRLSDGRAFTLVLDFEALVQAESAYGKPLSQTMADASAGFVGALRALLYGALQANHPGVSLREASEIYLTNADAVTTALTEAGNAAMPTSKGDGEGANPPGKNSGRSGAKRA